MIPCSLLLTEWVKSALVALQGSVWRFERLLFVLGVSVSRRLCRLLDWITELSQSSLLGFIFWMTDRWCYEIFEEYVPKAC